MLNVKETEQAVQDFQALLDRTPAEAAHVRVGPDAWTLTEIVGHLIDSAANNHQRFVRLRFGDLDNFPGYDAEPWVAAQGYDQCDFAALAALWSSYNALLLHLAAATPETALRNAWTWKDKNQTLEAMVEGYATHLRMHIEHYRTRMQEVEAHLGGR